MGLTETPGRTTRYGGREMDWKRKISLVGRDDCRVSDRFVEEKVRLLRGTELTETVV